MGEGARRLPSEVLIVAARRGFRSNVGLDATEVTAEFGGGLGIVGVEVSVIGFAKAGPLRDSLLKMPALRSTWGSGRGVC